MRPWLAARVSDRFASGSCTFEMICQVLEPDDVAASTTVAGTPRMPSATSLMDTGAANTTAAAIAVNRVGPNRPRNGTRYTNAGITWAASSVGRISRSARSLRPIQTPTTTPSTITTMVATSVDASVTIESCHRPVPSSRPRHTAATTIARTPAIVAVIARMTAQVRYHGESAIRDWSGLSRPYD